MEQVAKVAKTIIKTSRHREKSNRVCILFFSGRTIFRRGLSLRWMKSHRRWAHWKHFVSWRPSDLGFFGQVAFSFFTDKCFFRCRSMCVYIKRNAVPKQKKNQETTLSRVTCTNACTWNWHILSSSDVMLSSMVRSVLLRVDHSHLWAVSMCGKLSRISEFWLSWTRSHSLTDKPSFSYM